MRWKSFLLNSAVVVVVAFQSLPAGAGFVSVWLMDSASQATLTIVRSGPSSDSGSAAFAGPGTISGNVFDSSTGLDTLADSALGTASSLAQHVADLSDVLELINTGSGGTGGSGIPPAGGGIGQLTAGGSGTGGGEEIVLEHNAPIGGTGFGVPPAAGGDTPVTLVFTPGADSASSNPPTGPATGDLLALAAGTASGSDVQGELLVLAGASGTGGPPGGPPPPPPVPEPAGWIMAAFGFALLALAVSSRLRGRF